MKGHITCINKKNVAIITLPKDIRTGKYPQKRLSALPYESKKDLEIRMNLVMAQYRTFDMKDTKYFTFSALLKQWINVRNGELAQSTIDGYNIYINKHIIPSIGNIALVKLKPMDIQMFYSDELLKYKGVTVLQIHHIIHKALDYARVNKMIPENPADFIDPPKKGQRFVPEVYDVDDFQRLLDTVHGTIDEIYIILAGGLGLRAGEVFGLKWDNINFDENSVYINETIVRTSKGLTTKPPKNETSTRTIFMCQDIANLLKTWHDTQEPSDYVVNKYNSNTYSNRFREQVLMKHNLKQIRFHDLRHFNAIFMLLLGVSDKEASERLGHSSPEVTRNIYQHVLKSMDKKVAQKFNALFVKSA